MKGKSKIKEPIDKEVLEQEVEKVKAKINDPMRVHFFKSIKARLLFSSVLGALLGMVIIVLITLNSSRSSSLSLVKDYLYDLTQSNGKILEYLIEDFVHKVNIHNIPFLDYTLCKEFKDPDLYFNSFLLNMKGRKKFTQRVLSDLGIYTKDGQ